VKREHSHRAAPLRRTHSSKVLAKTLGAGGPTEDLPNPISAENSSNRVSGEAVRGRPPRHLGERLSKNRTFRVRGKLDEKLQAAATASGRSVSEEIEFRLDQSFDRDAFLGVMLGHDESAKALQAIAIVMKLTGREGNWAQHADTAERVRLSVALIIAQFATRHAPPPTTEISLEASQPQGWCLPDENYDRAADLAIKALEAVGSLSSSTTAEEVMQKQCLTTDTFGALVVPCPKKYGTRK
jgi:hypothetical protein